MAEKAKKKELSLVELTGMRNKGIVKDSDEVIAEKRAARAKKRAECKGNAELKAMFPTEEKTKEVLRALVDKVRYHRKRAVDEGITSFSLPKELKEAIYMAFKLNYSIYRVELGDLSIEGLKVQDREVKAFTYHFNDGLMSQGIFDFGWIIRMLNKKYVSRYGWKLLRKHRNLLAPQGRFILGAYFDQWAKNEDTQLKWERLAKEDGLPVDMREVYSMN